MMKPRAPLRKSEAIIDRGRIIEASLISSAVAELAQCQGQSRRGYLHIWVAESAPGISVSLPTMKES